MVSKLTELRRTSRLKSESSYYLPLTAEEQEAAGMSEEAIKDWETKGKTGLLFGDSTVQSALSKLRSVLYTRVDVGGGKTLSLYDIGITTSSDLTKGGQLEIADEDKLSQFIAAYGDDVTTLFTKGSEIAYTDTARRTERFGQLGIAGKLNDVIEGIIGSNGTLYNKAGLVGTASELSNSINTQLTKQDTAIQKLIEQLAKKEERYYEKFSAMEQAIINANNQISAITDAFLTTSS
jgi:flagellar hook-associated protein 2